MIGEPKGMRDGLALSETERELTVMRPAHAAAVSLRHDGIHVMADCTLTPDECAELVSMLDAACAAQRELMRRGNPEPHERTSA